MAKKELILEWDDSKQYKFFSKEIMIPFLALQLMAFGPIVNLAFSGTATPYLMADINAAAYLNLQNIINSVFRAVAALVWGSIFDRFNRKTVLLMLALFQMAAGLIYAAIVNVPMLIIGTLIGAIGSGGATAGLVTLLGLLLPMQYRGTYHSVRSLVQLGMTTLTPLGAWIIEKYSFRYVYILNFTLYTLIFIVTLILIPSMPANLEKVKTKFRYDWGGSIIFVIGTAVLFGASFVGGKTIPWTSPIIYLFILGGIAIYGVGLWYEGKHEDIGLISVRLLKNRAFISAVLVGCMYYASFTVKTYEQILSVQGLGMTLTAFTTVRVIPTMLGHGIGIVYPILMQKTGWYRGISGFVVVLNVVSMIYWATMKTATTTTVFIALILSAATPLSLGQLLAVNSVDKEDMGRAGGTYTFMYYFSSALFSLIFNILLNNIHLMKLVPNATAAGIYSKLTPAQLQTMETYTVLASPKSLAAFKATFGANTDLYNKAVKVISDCVTDATRVIFWVSAVLTATAIFGVFGLRKDMKFAGKPKAPKPDAPKANS